MLNCITVDDSSIQLKVLSELVKRHPALNLVGEYSNAIEASEVLKNTKIDLIFLDIEMPGISGFDLLSIVHESQQVIVVSANRSYAYDAFKHDVTSFLGKPIVKDEFDRAVKRALVFQENIYSKKDQTIADDSIFIKSNLINKKIQLRSIKWVEAVGDYVKVVTDTENHIVLSTMKSFIKKLPENRFMRIHKSFIANLERVNNFNSKIVEIEGTELPLSRTRKSKLFDVLKAN